MMDSLLGHNMGVLTEPVLQPVLEEMEEVNITQQISQSTDLYQTFTLLYGGNPALLLLPHIVRFLVRRVHSHWSSSYITALSLVQSFPSDAGASSLMP